MDNDTKFYLFMVVILGIFLWFFYINQNPINVYAQTSQETLVNTITFSEILDKEYEPDIVKINLILENKDINLKSAYDKNKEMSTKLLASLSKFNIQQENVKTIDFQVIKEYNSTNIEQNTSQGKISYTNQQLSEFKIVHAIEISVDDINLIGEVVDSLEKDGFEISGVDFDFSEKRRDEIEKEMKKELLEKAKSKAEDTANQMQVKIRGIRRMDLSNSMVNYPMYKNTYTSAVDNSYTQSSVFTGKRKLSINGYFEFII